MNHKIGLIGVMLLAFAGCANTDEASSETPLATCDTDSECDARDAGADGEPASELCGDGLCDPAETEDNCPVDCLNGVVCGDTLCATGETAENCPVDCSG